MKYTVIGKAAVLTTREVERIGDALTVEIEGFSDGGSLCLDFDGRVRSFDISGGRAVVPCEELTAGRCSVMLVSEENGVQTEAEGNALLLYVDTQAGELCAIPAPVSCATEHERLWCVIAEMLGR